MKHKHDDRDSIWQAAKTGGMTWRQVQADTRINPTEKSVKAIRRACERYRKRQRDALGIMLNDLPTFSEVIYQTPEIETDNVIITSDWEIPDVNTTMAKLAMALGVHYNIRQQIIAGDLVAGDETGIASHLETWQDGHNNNYEKSINITRQLLYGLSKQFDKIAILEGNHDDRIARISNGQVHLGMLLKGTPVDYMRYYDLWIKTSRGYVLVMHPRQYRKHSQTLAEAFWTTRLAPDGTKPKTIIIAHTHQRESGYSPDADCELYGLGCLRDYRKTKYKARGGAPFPQWNSGLLMIKDGYCYPIGLDSNFKFWLGHLADMVT